MTIYGAAGENELPGHAGVVQEANERWHAIKDWQGSQDDNTVNDIKFANADTLNQWQWDKGIYDKREGQDLPCLTVNITRTHNDIIINEMSKTGYGIKVRPTGGTASYKSAQVMQSIIRRIEYVSKASAAYRKVAEQQVDGGIGYILIETAYVSNRTRDQDIYLKASRDPTGVYLDPWIREPDGSDANFGFVFERMPRKEFNRKYPAYKDKIGIAPLDTSFQDWISDKEIMLAKYFRKKRKADIFVWYEQDDGEGFEGLASEIREKSGEDIYKQLMSDIREKRILGGTRKVFNDEVEWFLIAGDTVVDEGDWAGKYIPICRCVGRELVIDSTLDRKGHTRPLRNAQEMLNYNASMSAYIVGLQPVSPYMAPARSIEGQEQYKTLNINGFPVILYNDLDDDAPVGSQTIAAPQRQDTPKPSLAHEQGMQTAERHVMMISGQFQAQKGMEDQQSAASGVAINERKEQGDTATYHFNEHMGDMKRFLGVQLLDLIPKIYDTKRTLHVLDEDGEKSWIMIDPNQSDAVSELEHEKEDEEAVKLAFNPTLGEYECISDPGPDFATQRQEGWNAMSMILQNNKELTATCSDLLFKYGDFPGADKIMERLQKEIKATKPYLFDDSAEPQVKTLQDQNQKLTALLTDLTTKLADEKLKIRGRDEKRDVDAFRADTERMKVQIEALLEKVLSPAEREKMQHDIMLRAHDHIYSMIEQNNAADIASDAADAKGVSSAASAADAENQPARSP